MLQRLDRRSAFRAIAGVAVIAAVGVPARSRGIPAAYHEAQPDPKQAMDIQIPSSLKAEHAEIHAELERLTRLGGRTGQAAREVAAALHSHFEREEELAMPALGLLQTLARGTVRPDMAGIVKLTDRLKQEMPAMLAEHQAIVGKLETLAEAGRQENVPDAVSFAETLTAHARMEEEVFYPAAILVGEYLELRLK